MSYMLLLFFIKLVNILKLGLRTKHLLCTVSYWWWPVSYPPGFQFAPWLAQCSNLLLQTLVIFFRRRHKKFELVSAGARRPAGRRRQLRQGPPSPLLHLLLLVIVGRLCINSQVRFFKPNTPSIIGRTHIRTLIAY